MSELEKMYREEHRSKRKKFIFYQQIGLMLLAVLLLVFTVVYFKTDKDTYVYYSEEGKAVHYANLTEEGQEYFGTDRLNGSHAYVTSLIRDMSADFSYKLKFDTDKVKYSYTYSVETQLEIIDVASGAPLYNPIVCTQIEPVSVSGEGNSFTIARQVDIDFQEYNRKANAFINDNGLKETSSSLIVRMSVEVLGASEAFSADHSNSYVTEIKIPLCKLAFKPTVSASVPVGEKKILALNVNSRRFFGALAIVSLVGFIVDVCVFVFFVIYTRDKYIDYSRKVARIRKNYKSYIQRIEEEFPTDGCRVLRLKDFTELLEIRDVVQKPILMYENADRTCTRFVISSDGLVYMHELKVQDDEQAKNQNLPEADAGDPADPAAEVSDRPADERSGNAKKSDK